VINVLDGSRTIAEALSSALGQKGVQLEVIVWDNGSSDRTREVVEGFRDDRIRYFRSEKTVPLYEARNAAIQECTGQFVAFLDADDWWCEDKLQRQLELFHPGVDAVYSNYFVVNEVNRTTKLYTRRRLPSGRVFSDLLRRYRIGLLTLVVRREVFNGRKFDGSLEIIGDFDFVMGLANDSQLACVQEPLAWSRYSGANESERKKYRHLEELDEWCQRGAVSGLLKGSDLRNMRRMVRAKRVEVELESGRTIRALATFLAVRPLGRQIKVAQRIVNSRRSSQQLAKVVDGS